MTQRIIKFRAWDTSERKMIDWAHVRKTELLWLDTESEWIFMQFTGLLDKNGKEIYEGDIVNDDGQVIFGGGRFFINYDKNHWEDLIGVKDEIIGNIYENPDLIK